MITSNYSDADDLTKLEKLYYIQHPRIRTLLNPHYRHLLPYHTPSTVNLNSLSHVSTVTLCYGIPPLQP